MPRHFANLTGAATLPTSTFQLTARIVDDLVANCAMGVLHGPAGTGKTYAMESALEDQAARNPGLAVTLLSFTSQPTMRLVGDQLLTELTGAATAGGRNRFQITAKLIDLLAHPKRLVVVDEAQRLNSNCIEMLRHLHDDRKTNFALLYVGGDGCWEVLSREPMLRSRIFRRLPFRPLGPAEIPDLIRAYHPIYEGADTELLRSIDETYGHGTMRDWASFTHTAAALCEDADRTRIDAEVVANAFTLLGGGVYA
ncbi:ATP-binding protein [Kitasatospora sp. NPDC096128]|uniref:ATP-binding protein n=1 Tax=Kitasatospora sp. NPDC096128 TaxID=3155547 RepID=UPI00331F1B0B